jgi:shikimate dehydrogenase
MKPVGATRLAGVIGWPISHSLSPRLHGYWLTEYGIDGQYLPLPVQRENFATVLNGLLGAGFRGVNVTVPHKEAAFALAHEADSTAKAAGAANLLLFAENGRLEARNTDVEGLCASLVDSLGTDFLSEKSAVLIGAGGAGRAAILALDALGARTILLASRDRARADVLAAAFVGNLRATLSTVSLPDLSGALGEPSILVNATSGGMKNQAPLDFDPGKLPKLCVVCDLVYNPLDTGLLMRAKAAGLRTVDGLGMLMHQAVPSFEAFFGIKPKVTAALRNALEEALKS